MAADLMVWGVAGLITLLTLAALCWRQWQQVGVVWLCVGVVPLGLYGFLGAPDVASQPAGAESPAVAARVVALMTALQQDPENVAVWAELATRHAAARRWDKSEAAFRGALILAPDAPMLKTGLAEVLVNRAGGMVPQEATALLRSVLATRPDDVAALYYLGLAALQRQEEATARGYWQRLAQLAPPDAPWYGDFMMNYASLMQGK